MTEQEHNDLIDLISKPGWKVYQSLLQYEYDKAYKKLRNSGKGNEITDRNLNFVNGILDGLEKAIKIAQREVDTYIPEETGEQPQ